MTKITIDISSNDYFMFRRWLKARDRLASLQVEPADGDNWRVTVELSKRYLRNAISRRWALC